MTELRYENIPEFILSTVRGFASSEEYEGLNATEQRLPGVVAAFLSRFLVRLQETVGEKDHTEQDARHLSDVYVAIETLASSHSKQVKTLVEDEIFENIRASALTWREIERRLEPQSAELYGTWRRKNPR